MNVYKSNRIKQNKSSGGGKMLKPNILIVDDSKISREILISMLEDEYNLYEANDGLEAIQFLEEKPEFYQLVLLDLNMPNLDGYGVLEIMKERGWLKELPVIIISAEVASVNRFGAIDFFTKPFDREIIFTRIRNVLAIYERYTMDSLTGGMNRKGFIRQVENFLQKDIDRTKYDILFFDIKNFKAVNELTGLENGNKVLCEFYDRLKRSEILPLVTARMESDHFVCLAKRQEEKYKYLDELCNQVYEENGKTFQIRVHCGIYHIIEKDISVSGMIDRARLAESFRKEEDTQVYTVYTTGSNTEYIDRVEIVLEFAQSIENDEFEVYYQPIMDTNTGEIASAEALVRWNHPKKGLISPACFIPALEKSGDISKLDMHIVEKVYQFQKQRWDAGKIIVPISINLSGVDFYDKKMKKKIMDLIELKEIPEWAIRFEITESSYSIMGERCHSYVDELRKHKIKVLIDDFGTGYSSLALLYNSNVDILKIDMAFVRETTHNSKARSIMRSIVDMGHQLELKLVAEGVETEEQAEFIKACECDYIQGYYFSRPLKEEDFVAMLEKYSTTGQKKCEKEESLCIPYFYRVVVHYTSNKMRQTASADNIKIASILKNNNAVGTMSGLFDEEQTICYVCDFCLAHLQLSFEELKKYTGNSYLKLIAPEDRVRYQSFESGVCEYHLLLPEQRRVRIKDVRMTLTTKTGQKQWISAIRLLDDEVKWE